MYAFCFVLLWFFCTKEKEHVDKFSANSVDLLSIYTMFPDNYKQDLAFLTIFRGHLFLSCLSVIDILQSLNASSFMMYYINVHMRH